MADGKTDTHTALIRAARKVVNRWTAGDLAGAVRELDEAIQQYETPKVAVFVNGGTVQEVRSNLTSLIVTLVDDDNDKETMTVRQRDEKCAAVEANHPHSLKY